MTLWGMADRLPARLARYIISTAAGEARLLEDGDVIAGLRVVHGPGHTPGSICLYSESQSALFLGDVLNNERGIRTPPWTVNHSHRWARLAPQRLQGLRFEQAYFGHGPSILTGADQRVLAFLPRARLGPGPPTGQSYAGKFRPPPRPRPPPTSGATAGAH